MVEVYRREQWWKTLASVLQTLLRCAYLLGYLQDYFLFTMEIISYCIPLLDISNFVFWANTAACLILNFMFWV